MFSRPALIANGGGDLLLLFPAACGSLTGALLNRMPPLATIITHEILAFVSLLSFTRDSSVFGSAFFLCHFGFGTLMLLGYAALFAIPSPQPCCRVVGCYYLLLLGRGCYIVRRHDSEGKLHFRNAGCRSLMK